MKINVHMNTKPHITAAIAALHSFARSLDHRSHAVSPTIVNVASFEGHHFVGDMPFIPIKLKGQSTFPGFLFVLGYKCSFAINEMIIFEDSRVKIIICVALLGDDA
jgi:hypothetical protein